jgi:CHAT domain-containing protein
MTKAEAIRQAQLSLLQGKITAADAPQRAIIQVVPVSGGQTTAVKSNSPEFSHPYYWTPFVLIGNGL